MKATTKRLVGAVGRLGLVSSAIRHPWVQPWFSKLPRSALLYGNNWERFHPFDAAYGIETTGFVSPDALPAHEAARVHAVCYAGSQPSVVRAALAAVPTIRSSTFVDLGCGKGRALVVASEFSFTAIIGVELSPQLAQIAQRNAEIIARQYPQRTPIQVAIAEASGFPFPAGDLVIFLYHPFSAELVAKVVAGIEAALRAEPRTVFVVYCNPVAGSCFDASPLLHRHFARMLPYAAEERGFGPDEADTMVIWHSGTGAAPKELTAAKIVVSHGMRAVLEPTDPPPLV